ncbi:hypothetical protein QPK13_03220 [Photorhabdus tasmaniensis]
MLTKCLALSNKGNRREQLDRFFHFRTDTHSVSIMIDGFSYCGSSPHYVDYLGEQFATIQYARLDSDSICDEINRILNAHDGYPGKASIAIIVSDQEYYRYMSLGDTRIYWPSMQKRTVDHTLAQRCVEQGKSPAETLRTHPLRNRVTQFVSKDSTHHFCYKIDRRIPGEVIIMCTDGFWCQYDDKALYLLDSEEAIEHAFREALSKSHKLHDNFSTAFLRDR